MAGFMFLVSVYIHIGFRLNIGEHAGCPFGDSNNK